MVAPVAKGAIIAASIIVAAGIALYENPQVRAWIDQSRRKIAIAIRELGEELQPPARTASQRARNEAEQRARRNEIIRRNREELINRARQEGVAVDLDTLSRVGEEFEEKGPRVKKRASTSFDELVGGDGRLRELTSQNEKAGLTNTATGTDATSGQDTLRQRGSGARGFMSGAAAAFANPFDDDASALYDEHLIGPDTNDTDDDDEAPVPHTFAFAEESRQASATVEPEQQPLVDVSDTATPASASIQDSTPSLTDQDATASFYSVASSRTASHLGFEEDVDDDFADANTTGTLTPTEDGALSTAASLAGTNDDIAVLSQHIDTDNDTHNAFSSASHTEAEDQDLARSETFSESGFTEAGFSEAGFSELGARTPSSWSEVGSDFGSGDEGLLQHGGQHGQ